MNKRTNHNKNFDMWCKVIKASSSCENILEENVLVRFRDQQFGDDIRIIIESLVPTTEGLFYWIEESMTVDNYQQGFDMISAFDSALAVNFLDRRIKMEGIEFNSK